MRLNVRKIKLLLAEKQMTIAQFAKEAEMNQALVGAIIRRGTCSIKSAGRLATALGVDPAVIVET